MLGVLEGTYLVKTMQIRVHKDTLTQIILKAVKKTSNVVSNGNIIR
jgi:predicted DNA-binding protein (UPF0251 family)